MAASNNLPIPPGPPRSGATPEESELQWAKTKLGTFEVLTVWSLAMIYGHFSTEGLHLIVTASSHKLGKIPFLGLPFRIKAFESADVALLMAMLLFVCVSCAAKYLLRSFLAPRSERAFDPEVMKGLVTPGAVCLLMCDTILLYMGICARSWGGVTFSFAAALVCMTMSLVLVFTSLITLKLERDIDNLKGA